MVGFQGAMKDKSVPGGRNSPSGVKQLPIELPRYDISCNVIELCRQGCQGGPSSRIPSATYLTLHLAALANQPTASLLLETLQH